MKWLRFWLNGMCVLLWTVTCYKRAVGIPTEYFPCLEAFLIAVLFLSLFCDSIVEVIKDNVKRGTP